jgi:S1-C subfamily serine protease
MRIFKQFIIKPLLGTFIFLMFSNILFAQKFNTEQEFINYFEKNCRFLNPIEGMWLVQGANSRDNEKSYMIGAYYTTAIIKDGSYYVAYRIKDGYVKSDFYEVKFSSKGNFFGAYNAYVQGPPGKAWTSATVLDNNKFEYSLNVITGLFVRWKFSKKLPLGCEEKKPDEIKPASGTGFAISSNGIIATNFHVIEGASSIKVRGINSDFNTSYSAKVVVSDKNNDLALIQIDDYNFSSLGNVPYVIKSKLAGVGENIFVLGYPLRASMGDEIKLTNGIVSSKTGFQGDITSYQISAPVQPGHSGGPLFDNQGNLIGIINAKHIGAENASYAVKSSFLTNLFELLSSLPKLQTVNSLNGKSLTSQVEIVKKFVYIIETQ